MPQGEAGARAPMQLEEAVVAAHDPFAEIYRRLVLEAPRIGPLVQPGQFVHLRLPAPADAILRRPFSVFKADARTVHVLYKAVGRGTLAMTRLAPGERLSVLGPLGRGFPAPTPGRRPVLVAGGYGMAALYLQAARAPQPGVGFVGGRSAVDILCVAEVEALGWRLYPATEDGTLGARGRVTDVLDRWLAEQGDAPLEFFACGPNAMLRAVAERARRRDAPAWISMDRNMGCGVGACLTCVQKVRDPAGGWTWARCCREGPVFEGREVVWEGEP